MKEKIRACLLQAHSSVINGVDMNKASNLLEEMFKSELGILLDEVEDLWISDIWDMKSRDELVETYKIKYKLND